VVRLVRERCRTADTTANARELVRQAAEEAHIQIAFLPFRAPELMPCEDLWRPLKAVVAANRAYADISE
jgi:hypothetical protein